MPLVVTKPESTFELAPEGTLQAVITAVKDLGKVETKFGPKEKVRIRWCIDQKDAKGFPISIIQQFTKSLHEKAGLYKMIKAVTGKEPGRAFDLEKLIGLNATLIITHSEDKKFANIEAIVKLPAGAKLLSVPNNGNASAITEDNPISSEDCPF